jgi:WD40 repeat protein
MATTHDLDGTIRIWNAAGGDPLQVLHSHDGTVTSVAFPDRQRLVSGGDDHVVRVWDLVGGGRPMVLGSHNSVVMAVAFSGNNRQVASAGTDGTTRVWDPTGTIVYRSKSHRCTSSGVSVLVDKSIEDASV